MVLRVTKSKIFFFTLIAMTLSLTITQWLPRDEISFIMTSADERFAIGPYPDQEKLSQLKAEGYTTIVSLLHPFNLPREAFLIHDENTAVAATGLNLIHIPVLTHRVNTMDGNIRIEELINSNANGKYYVHGFKDNERGLMFLKLVKEAQHNSQLANIAMQDGKIKIIAKNVVIGPRPHRIEFQERLESHGISGIGYAGQCDSNDAMWDKQLAENAKLKWVCLQVKDNIVLSEIKKKGPWYVYGPVLPLIEGELVKRISRA